MLTAPLLPEVYIAKYLVLKNYLLAKECVYLLYYVSAFL
jgi:hypothetical protein